MNTENIINFCIIFYLFHNFIISESNGNKIIQLHRYYNQAWKDNGSVLKAFVWLSDEEMARQRHVWPNLQTHKHSCSPAVLL